MSVCFIKAVVIDGICMGNKIPFLTMHFHKSFDGLKSSTVCLIFKFWEIIRNLKDDKNFEEDIQKSVGRQSFL